MAAKLPLLDLGPRYLECFSEPEKAEHAAALPTLSPERPVRTIVRGDPERGLRCTVIAFDYPSEFSYITGVLSSMGFDIEEGDAFTLEPPAGETGGTASGGAGRRRSSTLSPAGSGANSGARNGPRPWPPAWSVSSSSSSAAAGTPRPGRSERVAELAASALEEIGPPERTLLYPVAIEVEDWGRNSPACASSPRTPPSSSSPSAPRSPSRASQ